MKQLVVFLFSVFAMSQSMADEAAKQRLIDLLEQQETLTADFEQRTYGSNSDLQSAYGFLKIAKPLRFVWHVTQPFEQQVISDGETLWVFDPDLEQATYQPVATSVSQSPAMILAQPRATLAEQYEVLEAGNAELTAYRLFPTAPDALFQEITLLFVDEQIDEIRILDSAGQETVISLNNVELNKALDAALFEFVPPPGTDLFEQM